MTPRFAAIVLTVNWLVVCALYVLPHVLLPGPGMGLDIPRLRELLQKDDLKGPGFAAAAPDMRDSEPSALDSAVRARLARATAQSEKSKQFMRDSEWLGKLEAAEAAKWRVEMALDRAEWEHKIALRAKMLFYAAFIMLFLNTAASFLWYRIAQPHTDGSAASPSRQT